MADVKTFEELIQSIEGAVGGTSQAGGGPFERGEGTKGTESLRIATKELIKDYAKSEEWLKKNSFQQKALALEAK